MLVLPTRTGETASDVLATVLARDPDWSHLPADTPPAIRRLLRRCLVRDPRQRLHDIADARLELCADPEEVAAPARAESRRTRLAGLAPCVLLLALAVALWGSRSWAPSSPAPVRRYLMSLPDGEEIAGWFARLALSPDGSKLVYVTEGARGVRALILRPLDQMQGRRLAGTEGAEVPFFSPDGESIGFFSPRGTLKVVSVAGGEAVPVARTLVGYAGASWGPDGFIYADADGEGGLVRVRAGGGSPEPFTTVDASRGEREHIWPEALPDGNGVLFVIKYQSDNDPMDIAVAEVATGHHRVLVPGLAARYAAGHIFFVASWDDGSIRYQPFDAESLTLRGEATILTDEVWLGAVGAPHFVPDLTVSRTGTLMTTTSGRQRSTTEVDWVSRDGSFRPVDPAWTDQLGGAAADA